jgi:hypothetical protein
LNPKAPIELATSRMWTASAFRNRRSSHAQAIERAGFDLDRRTHIVPAARKIHRGFRGGLATVPPLRLRTFAKAVAPPLVVFRLAILSRKRLFFRLGGSRLQRVSRLV